MKFIRTLLVAILCVAAIVHAYRAEKHVLEVRRAAMMPPHMTTWIHAFGCSEKDTYIYLVFSNGEVSAIGQSALSAAQKDQLIKFIGDMSGYVSTAKCGAQS